MVILQTGQDGTARVAEARRRFASTTEMVPKADEP
jgi:hypothetical protein